MIGLLAIIAALIAIFGSVIIKQLEKFMSQVTDAIASVEAALAKASTDLQTLAANSATQAAAITALQAQLANAGLSQADTDALAKVVTDANALATAADAAAASTVPPVEPPTPAAA